MKIDFENVCYGKFIRREKRFFVYVEPLNINNDFVEINGEKVAYCSNVGKMSDVLIPESLCLFSRYEGKLRWKWEAVLINDIWIGVNTQNPNYLIKDHLKNIFPNEEFKSEVTFGHYRCDFASSKKVIEVKNVHWKTLNPSNPIENVAYFPDCVTQRGSRQLKDMIEILKKFDCYLIYVVQRNDINYVGTASWIDKKYSDNLKIAQQHGLKVLGFKAKINQKSIEINKEIEYL